MLLLTILHATPLAWKEPRNKYSLILWVSVLNNERGRKVQQWGGLDGRIPLPAPKVRAQNNLPFA